MDMHLSMNHGLVGGEHCYSKKKQKTPPKKNQMDWHVRRSYLFFFLLYDADDMNCRQVLERGEKRNKKQADLPSDKHQSEHEQKVKS